MYVWAHTWLTLEELSGENESLMHRQTGINDKHSKNARHNDPNMQNRPAGLETASNMPPSWQLETVWIYTMPNVISFQTLHSHPV